MHTRCLVVLSTVLRYAALHVAYNFLRCMPLIRRTNPRKLYYSNFLYTNESHCPLSPSSVLEQAWVPQQCLLTPTSLLSARFWALWSHPSLPLAVYTIFSDIAGLQRLPGAPSGKKQPLNHTAHS